jgi:hypothetical protein
LKPILHLDILEIQVIGN